MRAQVNIAGHAAHPLMVTVPIGLSVGAAAFDLLTLANPRSPTWSKGAYALLGLSAGSAAAAATAGFLDWRAIPSGTRAKNVGLLHLSANSTALALTGASLLVRARGRQRRSGAGMLLSAAALVTTAIGGWLGGELVERLGMGVHPGANPDAPSSLRRQQILLPVSKRYVPPPLTPNRVHQVPTGTNAALSVTGAADLD